jgi:hypothetical protein
VSDAEQRAAARRARYQGGVARSFEEMAEVDLDFWLAMTPSARIGAIWSLTEDSLALEGQRGATPRLQRSVGGVRPMRG